MFLEKFFFLHFLPIALGSDEEDGEGSESGGGIGLTNPVSSLLERSKKQVEHYFSGTQDEVEAKEEETSSSGGSSSSKGN